MPGKIQLVLPGLFDLPLHELKPGLLASELPALNRILRLATPRPSQAFTIDAILQQVLTPAAAQPGIGACLPLAQAFAPDDDAGRGERLLLFRAVHLQPDLHSAIVVPIPQTRDNLNDISIIINDLKDIFNVDCDITAVADGLYLAALKEFDAPAHYPHILSVLGKPANPYIEQSRNNLRWYKLLNEMQMFLHQHEVNQQRARSGLLPVNSLWFWGGGEAPRRFDSSLAWYCDDPVLNRFAESLGLTTAALADVAGMESAPDTVCIDLRLLEWLKTGVSTELDQLLLEIEGRLLKPLSSAASAARKSLTLRAGFEFDFEMTPASGLKFWRKSRDLASWVAG